MEKLDDKAQRKREEMIFTGKSSGEDEMNQPR